MPELPLVLPHLGLDDIDNDITPDAAFCSFGDDPERAANWEVQARGATAFAERIFGRAEAASESNARLMHRFRDPDVFVSCQMYYVGGRKPG